ncbi:TetR/AcrR family transcriptional regulator [Saccharospirillum salsuginis]|uniref:TetR family transcriptional regulator n=1 Tax=Saccharospirillum salsuginis TaxID=418750 RepID=A0A918KJU8_9GAMM|nr:TetR/AcrR family transcriptional regulator [Saccharospirillum salsuginis]GGX63715.1 TetR family transcriptional regulator [Saccharospirillum salsuginis]
MVDQAQKRLKEAFQTKEKAGRIRQQNEAVILEAAEIEFAQHGFKGTSLNAIAERAGLPKSNILYYFQNKVGLYGAVLSDILDMWNQSFNDTTADDDPFETLNTYIRSKIRYSRSHPLASKIFAIEIIQGAPHLKKFLAQELHNWVGDRARVIQAWIDAGKMDPVDPVHLLFLIWGGTQHYADFGTQVQWALDKPELGDEDFKKAEDTLCHIILKGIGLAR